MTRPSAPMFGRFAALVFIALALTLSSPAFSKRQADFDPKAYAEAVAKAEAGDPGVDYLWLRKQASAQFDYAEANWTDWQSADSLVDTSPDQALGMARARLAGVWTDFMAHIVAQLALEKLGRHEDAEREHRITGAIISSIAGGHKGTSAADSFNAVNVAEEYRVLFLLHWKFEGQSLVNQDGHSFDVFDVTDMKTNQKRQVWFNIDIYFGKEFGL